MTSKGKVTKTKYKTKRKRGKYFCQKYPLYCLASLGGAKAIYHIIVIVMFILCHVQQRLSCYFFYANIQHIWMSSNKHNHTSYHSLIPPFHSNYKNFPATIYNLWTRRYDYLCVVCDCIKTKCGFDFVLNSKSEVNAERNCKLKSTLIS